MAEFAFETEWTGGKGAIDRSQQLSAAVAAAAKVLAASVADGAGGAETPGAVLEHLDSLRDANRDLVQAFENMAGQLARMRQHNILISVKEEGAQTQRSADAVLALSAAADGARQLDGLISAAREPLLDLALTTEAGSAVWDLYQ
ncbi:hypothetical protein ABUW04_01945 [Streptacidiphilus sp. N1-10]|uniref:Uncharacterized protein n=1 Tax=Streptacidiphilus jeojiensis TaxID=3229225 RepID=A0ABV6XFL5_9ACTN